MGLREIVFLVAGLLVAQYPTATFNEHAYATRITIENRKQANLLELNINRKT